MFKLAKSMNENQSVFSPIKVGNTIYKNRIILAPQKPRNCAISRTFIHEEMEFWRKFAQGGAACLTIGATPVNPLPDGKGRDGNIPVHDDSCLVPLSRFADMTHMYGCKASIELCAYDKPGSSKEQLVEIVPDAVTVDEIRAYVKNFADAAERCVIAGMDAIVIHGAHGHFPAAFFSKAMNKRTDEFGADTLENRARVADMILDAIRERVGRKIVVEWRLSINDMYPGSPTFDEIVWFVRHIQDRVDIVHVSRGLHRLPSHERFLFTPIYTPRGINLKDAAALKEQVSVLVCAVGGITIELAEEYISTGKLDFVAMARELYADPDLPRKAKAGRKDEIRPCVRCNACINNTHVHRMPAYCAVNVNNNREVLFDTFPKPAHSRHVAVVGGGPAGMEAARTAAMRGHKVTLFEKSDALGGMLKYASVPWFKKDIKDYLDWAVRMTQRDPNITVKLNSEANAELLKAEGFDTVIVANGGTPIMPGFLQGKANVAW
ncbi:MAG: FAD-dependent oxidoreductase, partial [Thermoanaerobacteraceae bacterium]|nr:FAD-dependent oxidoreductase [Thermoanaerobacteraceae bacterium]